MGKDNVETTRICRGQSSSRRCFACGLIAIGGLLLLVAGALFLQLGPIADKVLANAIGPEDHEFPLTAVPLRASSDNVQLAGGQGAGLDCSLPQKNLLEKYLFRNGAGHAPLSLKMRQACVFHDYCYRHGAATYGYTQADCDYLLQEHAFRLCSRSHATPGVAKCETAARQVTLGVRAGGAESFHPARPKAMQTPGYLARVWQTLVSTGEQEQLPSTYFEFDSYPIRSLGYTVTRVANAPAQWVQEGGAFRKALYVFSVRRSGLRVNIIGFGLDRRLCASLQVTGSFTRIPMPPMVVHLNGSQEDWFVWPQRSNVTLDDTDVHFDGISPARATLQDWRRVFGSANVLQSVDCKDQVYLTRDASGEKAYFSQLRPMRQNLAADMLISEFHALNDVRQAGLAPDKLHLFGLTTHGCSASDASTCVGHVQIDPGMSRAEYEPYRTLDPNCIKSDHRDTKLVAEAAKVRAAAEKNRRDCDAYRSFATPPLVTAVEGAPALAWLRRGESDGDGYDTSAILRTAPARDPKSETSGSGAKTFKPGNFTDIRLDGFSERLEPAVLVQGMNGTNAFASLVQSRDCAIAIQITWLAKSSATSSKPFSCVQELGAEWAARPFALIDGKDLMLAKTSVELSAEHPPQTVAVHVEIARISVGEAVSGSVLTKVARAFSLNVCEVGIASDAKWTLSSRPCVSNGGVKYGRIRDMKDKSALRDAIRRVAAGAVNSSPIIPAFLDDDGLVDIAIPNPLDRTQAVWLKGDASGFVLQSIPRSTKD